MVKGRVEEVLTIRLDGAQFHDIRQYASEKGWRLSDRQLWRYVAASDALLAESFEKDREKLLIRHVAQRKALFARAVNAADYRAALAIAHDEASLQNLYDAPKVAVSVEAKVSGRVTHDVAAELAPYAAAIADLCAGRLGYPPGEDAPPGLGGEPA